MSLGLALQTALTGLQAQQQKSAILARNVANATTPGYTRKEVTLASLTVGGEGRGVTVRDVRRSADAHLAREVRTQSSDYAAKAARADALAVYTESIGQPQEERSLSSAVTALETAFLALEELPDNPVQQRAVVDAAVSLANRLNAADDKIKQVRQQADSDIAASVADVNQALVQLEKLNREVKMRTGSGQDTSELEDQRDVLLDRIADQIGIQYFTRSPNELVVMTDGGVTLLDGSARMLEFTPTAVIGSTTEYPSMLSGLKVEGADIAPGSGYPLPLKSGRIAGLFAVRDSLMPQARRQIDEIASVLADRFQAADASIAGTGLTDTGLFTDGGVRHSRTPPYSAASPGPAGLAGRIAVNDLVRVEAGGNPALLRTGIHAATTGDVGDTAQIRSFLGVFQQTVSFDADAGLIPTGTLKGFASAAMGHQQVLRATAANDAKAQSVLLETVETARISKDGVNIEEEMQELLLIEKAFAAAGQVMQAASRMLDTLMEI